MIYRFKSIEFLIFLLILSPFLKYFSIDLWAIPPYDPKLSWNTLESKHFSIHYHDGEEEIAKRVVNIAESVFHELTAKIAWEPQGKTQLVLVDTSDSANGITTIYPYKRIKLYVSAPELNSPLDNNDDWLPTLVIHEYTHILHLDMIHSIPRVLRFLFGNIIAPNNLQPQWMIEGYATFQETVRTSRGRGRSAYAEMIIRSAILEDNFIPIDRASGSFKRWPAGQIPYIIGAKFHLYLAKKYGEEKIAEVYHGYAGRLIPFFINTNCKKILGKKITTLWEEWASDLKEQYEKEVTQLKSEGLTKSEPLTTKGNIVQTPKFMPDGEEIIYSYLNMDGPPEFILYNLKKREEKILLKDYVTDSFSLSKDGKKIIFSATKTYKRYYYFDDIFVYDREKKSLLKLTEGVRAKDPSLHPHEDKILCVINKLGNNDLAIYNIKSNNSEDRVTYLTQNHDGTQYSTPRWSPDGKHFVVSVWQKGGSRNLYLFNEDGTEPISITYDNARNIHPSWSPDGRFILFSSDRTGIPNIFAYDRFKRRFYQVTNVITGAFMPDVSPDMSKLAFILYSSRGYDLHIMEFNPKKWKEVEFTYESLNYQEMILREAKFNKHPYNPLKTLFPPKVLIPDYKRGSIESILSLSTTGIDALERHTYSIGLSYMTGSRSLGYSIDYVNRSFLPTIGGGLSAYTIPRTARVFDVQGNYRGRLLLFEERFQILLGSSFPFDSIVPLPFPLSTGVSYIFNKRSRIGEIPFLIDNDPIAIPLYVEPIKEGIISGIRLSLSHGKMKSYPLSISIEKGRDVSFIATYVDKIFGSDFKTIFSNLDWREYFLLPLKHHVIALRTALGVSFGDPLKTYFLGGAIGESYFSPPSSTLFILRGYPDFIFDGEHIITGSLEYRFPLLPIERGYKTLPVFIDRFHMAIFMDYGNAFDSVDDLEQFHFGVGTELRANTVLGYGFPFTFRIGFASGLNDPDGINTFYLEFGTSF